jgi:hypothetical protein
MRRALLVSALCALLVPLVASAADDPVITVPADLTVEAQNFSGAVVNYTASAVDREGRPIPLTCTPSSGGGFGFGTTTVTCTASDGGKTATKQFNIGVVDTRPPAITAPARVRVSTTSRAGRRVTYAASAGDVVDGTVTVACAPASGTRFRVGTTNVTCSAADRRGNASSSHFGVIVALKRTRKAAAAMISPRAGARLTAPPMLRWRAVPRARFYNVQLFRHGQKLLSAWPSRPHFRLHARWTFKGRAFRLRAGSYTWLVWPAYGQPTHPRFGKALGVSSFVFTT